MEINLSKEVCDLIVKTSTPVSVIIVCIIFRGPIGRFIDSLADRKAKINANKDGFNLEVSRDPLDLRDGELGLKQREEGKVIPRDKVLEDIEKSKAIEASIPSKALDYDDPSKRK